MTRIEAYRHMLEGNTLHHHLLPGGIWRVDLDRCIRVNNSSSDWSTEFFSVDYLEDGWELYDQS